MGEAETAEAYRAAARELAAAIESHAWDGAWYLRAFYDDGTPLGTSRDDECQIDAIAQSWAVLSGAGRPDRAARAMAAVSEKLVREDDGIILLFTPPLDKTERDPGYIKGYAPGIRENGGQYTHAALWTTWAFAERGDGDRAWACFRLLNPIYHAKSREKMLRYRVEPYVIAADVYGAPPHVGRGGWTWYTGSAGWMYRLGLEGILGIRRCGNALRIRPCVPSGWSSYEVTYRFGSAVYHIQVENPRATCVGVARIALDGVALPGDEVPLHDDGRRHEVQVTMG
jgi:cellobiose phosphorylase